MGEIDSHLPVDAPDPAALSALLEGYDVQELVACGGMGAVYRARQVSLDREVAIKVLPRELAEDAEFSASFTAEARAMAKLAHPNLISVFDFGEVEGMFYLVMEFVEGDTLYAACHDQQVDPQQAVEIVRAVSAGLGVAHGEGIIHRDIKPANVFIGQDLVPKLGDFGLAVPSDDVASGMAMGTPGFVAPEVMEDPEAASGASDVFALGAMLHQLLSGITPTGEWEADLSKVPLAHGLRTLVQKSLAQDPAERFQNGKEMAEALAGWLEKAKRGVAQVQAGGGPQWGRGVAISGQSVAYVEDSGGGGGRLVLMLLVSAGLIGGGAWYVMGGDDDSGGGEKLPPVAPVIPEKKPGTGGVVKVPDKKPDDDPKEPDPVLSEEELAEKYLAALKDARVELMERRIANLQELQAAVDGVDRWVPYLDLVDAQTRYLPAYLTGTDGVELLPEDVEIVRKFVKERQESSDDQLVSEVEDLHLAWLREMRIAKLEPQSMVKNRWEPWVESLGLTPLYLTGINLAGEWERVDSTGGEAILRIDNLHNATIIRGGVEVSGKNVLKVFEDGRVVVSPNPEDEEERWILRLRDWELRGREKAGPLCEFVVKRFDLVSMVKDGKISGEVAGPSTPKKASSGSGMTDAVLVELNSKYMAAVERQIGPIVAGYRKVVNDSMALSTRRNDVRGVEQIGLELVRVESLGWEEGCVLFKEIDWEGVVPLSLQGKKVKFDRDFKEKMGRLQDYYIEQLNKMLVDYRSAGKGTAEIRRELDRFTTPPGTVRARYVKIQSNRTEGVGVNTAAIAEFVVLDREGEAISGDGVSIHEVSSKQMKMGDGAWHDRLPEHVLDGKGWSIWHSAWKPEAASWPHWLAVDLGEETFIRGFRYLPRQDDTRHSDFVNWTLFVSLDGKDWQEAAKGEFEKTKKEKEFIFQK